MEMKLHLWSAVVFMTTALMAQAGLTREEVGASAARIDAALEKSLGLQASGKGTLPIPYTRPATDAAFLRRASIDLGGRLPTANEVAAFLADTSTQKRSEAINRLLADSAAADWRFQRMADAFRITDEVCGVSQSAYVGMMRQVLADDLPIDQLLARLMRATGTLEENPAAGFLLRDQGQIEVTTAEVSRAFLGRDIHCAGCHDHPFDDYTQRNFYEFAACFNVVGQRGGQDAVPVSTPAAYQDLELLAKVRPFHLPRGYHYRDGKPGQQVTPAYLAVTPFPRHDPRSAFLARPSATNVREQLAQWLTSSHTSTLQAITAMRIWDWMFGLPDPSSRHCHDAAFELASPLALWQTRGCGQNVTIHYGSWLETHADFVAAVRHEFLLCDSRIGEFQRVLAHTEAYQREALSSDPLGIIRILPAPVVRRLPPEVLWDALTSHPRSIDLPQVPPVEHPLRLMGRGTRAWADESRRPLSHEMARLMMNLPMVTERAAVAARGVLPGDDSAAIQHLFLQILGRMPTAREAKAARGHLLAHPERAAVDIAWALLNTTEFLFES